MSLKIAGFDLRSFCLLEPSDKNIQKLATILLNEILKYFGYKLDRKAEIVNEGHYIKMIIGHSVDPLHYGYVVQNGNLILLAGGAYSMRFAVRDFFKLIQHGKIGSDVCLESGDTVILNILDNPKGLDKPQNSDLRLMSCNALATFWDDYSAVEDISFEMRTEIFKSYLQIYDPDVIGLQEICNNWMSCLSKLCENSGTWCLATGGGNRVFYVNPILYRADRYTLISQKWVNYSKGNSKAWGGRYMTCAVFESIATGDRFALINVHWSGTWFPEYNKIQSAETLAMLKELQSMYNCPVCITGDFNTFDFDPELEKTTTIPTPSIAATDYSYMLADGSVKDAKFYTDILVNDIGSVHGFGAAAYARNYSFDHVFCTSDTTVRQFYTACDNHQQYASDHAWLIVDVDLSTKKFFAFDE